MITQEVDGVGNLGEDEEELNDEDIKDADGLEDGFAARNEAGFESIPARRNPARRAKLNGGKAPRITQEVNGVGDLDKDEEEFDDEVIEVDEGLEEGFAACDEVEDEDVSRSTEDVAVRARAALAWEPRGHPPPNFFVRPNQPDDVATRALTALMDNEPYRNPRFVLDHIEDSGVAGRVFGESEAKDSS